MKRTQAGEKILSRKRTKGTAENATNEEVVEREEEIEETVTGHDAVVVALGGAKEAGAEAEAEVVAFLETGVEGMYLQAVIGITDAVGGQTVIVGVTIVPEIETGGVDAVTAIQTGKRGGIVAIEKAERKIVEGAAWVWILQTRDLRLIRHNRERPKIEHVDTLCYR
jgi:hypothetical protein